MGIGEPLQPHQPPLPTPVEDFATLCNKDATLEARQAALERLRPVFQSLHAKLSAEGGQAITVAESSLWQSVFQYAFRLRGFFRDLVHVSAEDEANGFEEISDEIGEIVESSAVKMINALARGSYVVTHQSFGGWALVVMQSVRRDLEREQRGRRRPDKAVGYGGENDEVVDPVESVAGGEADPADAAAEREERERRAGAPRFRRHWLDAVKFLAKQPAPASQNTVDYAAMIVFLTRYQALRRAVSARGPIHDEGMLGPACQDCEDALPWPAEVSRRRIKAGLSTIEETWQSLRQVVLTRFDGLRALGRALLIALFGVDEGVVPTKHANQFYQWKNRSLRRLREWCADATVEERTRFALSSIAEFLGGSSDEPKLA